MKNRNNDRTNANRQVRVSGRRVPTDNTQKIKIGKANGDILAGASGTIDIWWRDPGDATLKRKGTETETAWLDWMHGSEQISDTKEVVIEFFDDENLWRITGAECEDTTEQATRPWLNTAPTDAQAALYSNGWYLYDQTPSSDNGLWEWNGSAQVQVTETPTFESP